MKTKIITAFALLISTINIAQVNLTQNLKMYLPFTGNATDASGNTNVVTVSGAILTTDRFGDANTAYHFDGTNDFMSIALGTGMKPTYPFTFSCWVKLISTYPTAVNHLFNNDYTIPGTYYDGAIFNVPLQRLQSSVGDGGLTNPQHRNSKWTTPTVPIGTWIHVAAIVNSATDMHLFFNCAEVPSTNSGTGAGLFYTTGGGMIARANGGGGENYLNADLDEMRFYDRALTEDEIIALYYWPNMPPPVDVSLGADTTICTGSSFQLDAGNPGSDYLWSTGAITQTINVNATGNYWVTVTDECVANSDTISVIVQNIPPVNVTLGPDIDTCFTGSISIPINSQSQNATSYVWNTGPTTPNIVATAAGTYIVTAFNVCSSDIDTIVINQSQLPAINLGGDITLCATSYTISPQSNNGTGIVWNNSSTAPAITVTQSGTYWAATQNACGTDVDSITVTLNPSPLVALGADTTICASNTFILNSSGQPGNTILWSDGSNGTNLTVNGAGTYWIEETNSFGCSTNDTISIASNTIPQINLGPDITVCNQSYTITPLAIDSGAVMWNTGETTPDITITQSGYYWLTMINECGSYTDTVYVSFIESVDSILMIPNVFTPNGDNYNERFCIPTLAGVNGTMYIYNRWGNKLLETNDFVYGWDGGNHTDGVYFYILEYTDCDTTPGKDHGTVTLLRDEK